MLEDHVHLFVEAPPDDPVPRIVRILKGSSSRHVFSKSPWLRTQLSGPLWSPSYYVGSVGHVSEETVREYVNTQRERA